MSNQLHGDYLIKIKDRGCSMGEVFGKKPNNPEAFVRSMIRHLFDVEPTDTLQVIMNVFGKKNSRSTRDTLLGEVLIGEYKASEFLKCEEVASE